MSAQTTYIAHRIATGSIVIDYEKEGCTECLLLNIPDVLNYLKKTWLIADYTRGADCGCTIVTINVQFERQAYVNIRLIDYLTCVFTRKEAEKLIAWHESMNWVAELEQKFLKENA